MTNLTPMEGVTLADHVLRAGTTVHMLRPKHPGVNQAAMDDIIGKGSADWEEPHGND